MTVLNELDDEVYLCILITSSMLRFVFDRSSPVLHNMLALFIVRDEKIIHCNGGEGSLSLWRLVGLS